MNTLQAPAIERYRKRRVQDLETCRTAFSRGGGGSTDWTALETIGHRLKGNGASFGFPELGDLGARLEEGAKDQDRRSCSALIDELAHWVNENTGPSA